MKLKKIACALLCIGAVSGLYGCALMEEQWDVVEQYRLENTTTEEHKNANTTTEALKQQNVLEDFLHDDEMTLAGRIDTPNGFHRIEEPKAAKKSSKKKKAKKTTASEQTTQIPSVAEQTTQYSVDIAEKETTQKEQTTQAGATKKKKETAATEQDSVLGNIVKSAEEKLKTVTVQTAEEAMGLTTQQSAQSQTTQMEGVSNVSATTSAQATTEDITSKRDNTTGETYSIAEFMHNLEVKPADAKVLLYNGEEKENQDSYAAILNLKLDEKNLQQKASSMMRLYAEYFWTNQAYSSMQFHLNNGFLMDYDTWISGKRLQVNGNTASWYDYGSAGDNYPTLLAYLEYYFCYSGMASLETDSEEVQQEKIAIGDFFMDEKKENVAMVVDVAENAKGKQCFLLAAGGSPGQDIEILKNPAHEDPWYYADEITGTFQTPEFSLESTSRWHLQTADSTEKESTTTQVAATTTQNK